MKITASLISNPKNSSGVCSFDVNCDDFSDSTKLIIEITDSKYPPQIFNATEKKVIGLHTHILDAGDYEIKFKLVNSGKCVVNAKVIITLEMRGGLFDIVRNAQIQNNTPLFFEGGCDSLLYPYGSSETLLPWYERDDAGQYLDAQLTLNAITYQEYKYLQNFIKQGYVEIENLIDESLIDSVNTEIDDAIRSGYQGYEELSSRRLEQLHEHYPNIRRLWLDERHRRVVDLIFGYRGRPAQTLIFVCGSQQPAHSDLIYLTPFPAGYMCGTWIALQDVVNGSGELVIYPGSHRDKRIYMRDVGLGKINGNSEVFDKLIYSQWSEVSLKYKPMVYRPKKGSIVIWHENLLHGGSPRLDQSLERRSMVIHSFADGACVYYDATGAVGNVGPTALTD